MLAHASPGSRTRAGIISHRQQLHPSSQTNPDIPGSLSRAITVPPAGALVLGRLSPPSRAKGVILAASPLCSSPLRVGTRLGVPAFHFSTCSLSAWPVLPRVCVPQEGTEFLSQLCCSSRQTKGSSTFFAPPHFCWTGENTFWVVYVGNGAELVFFCPVKGLSLHSFCISKDPSGR